MFFMKQNKAKEATKAKERAEKESLKNVNITGTAETEIRKAQFEGEKKWKADKKSNTESLKNINVTE